MLRIGALVVSVGVLLVGAAPADAVVRYSSPAGTVTSGAPCTDPAGTCRIDYAFNAATLANDELVLAPGDYGSVATPTPALSNSRANVTVHAQPGMRARIFENDTVGLSLTGQGATLRDVEVDNAGQTAVAVFGTIERVIGRASSNGFGCVAVDVVLDSLCLARGTGGRGFYYNLNSSSAVTVNVTLRNLTAIGAGSSSEGIEIDAGSGPVTFNVSGSNVIARGTRKDVVATNSGGSATITLDHSNFATTETNGAGTSITPPTAASNQSAAPAFIDAAGGDYRQAAGSPTIDAGLTDPMNGQFDLDGNQRAQGASTDIGAYESTPVPAGPSNSNPSTPPSFNLQPLSPGPAQVSVGRVKGTPSGAQVTLSCKGQPGQFCVGREKLTTRERLKGTTVVKVTASKKVKIRRRTVTVGQVSYRIPAGKTATIKVPLNAKGRRLEKKFKRLPVTVTVTLTLPNGKSATVATRRVTLKAKRSRKHKKKA